MNTDIICRWRDAITDPPKDARTVILRQADGHEITAYNVADGQWHYDDGMPYYAQPGDQWLDVTDVPAVPRAQVQAAVKRIKDCREMARGNDEYTAFGTALDVIEEYTEVAP